MGVAENNLSSQALGDQQMNDEGDEEGSDDDAEGGGVQKSRTNVECQTARRQAAKEANKSWHARPPRSNQEMASKRNAAKQLTDQTYFCMKELKLVEAERNERENKRSIAYGKAPDGRSRIPTPGSHPLPCLFIIQDLPNS